MPLKLRIKPEGKCFVNGNGWIKNVGNRPIDILVHDLIAHHEDRIVEPAMVEEKRVHFGEKQIVEFAKAENPNSWTPLVRPNAKG